MKGTIDIRPPAVKNIGSKPKSEGHTRQLKDDSVSNHKPRSHVAYQALKTAGFYVQ